MQTNKTKLTLTVTLTLTDTVTVIFYAHFVESNKKAGGKMRMCRCADVVTGNLRIQNCGPKTANTTLIEGFA